MKNTFLAIILLVSFVQAVTAQMSVSPTSINYASPATGGQVITISVPSNISWSITSKPTWLSLATTPAGTGSGTVTIGTVTTNPSMNNSRTGSIVITFGGGATFSIAITQTASPANITLSQTSMTVSATMDAYSVVLNSNADWNATAISTGDWLNFSGYTNGSVSTSGNPVSDLTFNFYVFNNVTNNTRTATITISAGITSVTLTITQPAQEAPYLNTSVTSLEFEYDLTTVYFPVQVTSNTNWSISAIPQNASWVDVYLNQINYSGDNEILIGTTEVNDGSSDRTFTLTLSDGTNTKYITVTQKAQPNEQDPDPNPNEPVTGISDANKESDLKVYPNPSNTGVVNIESKAPVSIQIYSSAGNVIYNKEDLITHQIELEKGYYLIETTDISGAKITKKLIVE